MNARCITLAFVAAVLMVPAMVSAEPPSKVPIQAYLTDGEGVPLDTETTIQVELYDAESGGNSLHSEQLTVEPSAGSFTAYLGSQETLDLSIFRNNSEVWAAITVNGETLEPRLEIATAPYAASASYAENAGNATTLEGQSASDFEYSAGEGLTKEGQAFKVDKSVVQTRVEGSCGSNEFAVGIEKDGSLMCEAVSARLAEGSITSLKIQDRTLSASDLGARSVSYKKLRNSSVVSRTISDGSVAQPKLASGSVSTGKLQADAVTNGKLKDGAVGQSKLASGSVSTGKLKSNAVETGKLNDGSVTTAKLADSAVDGSKIANNSVGAAELQRDCTNTYMEPKECPIASSANAANFPTCEFATQGSYCRSTGSCSGAPDNLNNCTDTLGDPVSVWIKGKNFIIGLP